MEISDIFYKIKKFLRTSWASIIAHKGLLHLIIWVWTTPLRCEITLKYSKILQVHEHIYIDTSPLTLEDFVKCKYCDLTCSEADVLRKHIKKEHRNKCDKCYIQFKDQEAKNIHMWTDHPIQCWELSLTLCGVLNTTVLTPQ